MSHVDARVEKYKDSIKLTADEKRQMQRKVQTSHQEGVVVAWFKLKTGKAIHRTLVGRCVKLVFMS